MREPFLMNATIHFVCRWSILAPIAFWLGAFSLLAQDDLSDAEFEALMEDDAAFEAFMEDEDAFEAWLEEEFSGFDFSAYARLGVGHSSNVLLSPSFPQSAEFARTDLELFLMQYPDEKGEFYAFLSGMDIRYSDVEDAEKEVMWLADTQWKRNIGDRFKGLLHAQYIYFDQIIDLSDQSDLLRRERVEYTGYGMGTGGEVLLNQGNKLSLELMAVQEDYSLLGDDVKAFGVLAWERNLWKDANMELKLREENRDYDDRTVRDENGNSTGEDAFLEMDRTSVALEWNQLWGKSKAIDSSLEFKVLENRDNGVGYYDYDRWSIDLRIDGEWDKWVSSLSLGLDESEYILQKAARFSSVPREQTDIYGELFVKRKLSKRFSVYLLLEYEESSSNILLRDERLGSGEFEDAFDAFGGTLGVQIDLWGEP